MINEDLKIEIDKRLEDIANLRKELKENYQASNRDLERVADVLRGFKDRVNLADKIPEADKSINNFHHEIMGMEVTMGEFINFEERIRCAIDEIKKHQPSQQNGAVVRGFGSQKGSITINGTRVLDFERKTK